MSAARAIIAATIMGLTAAPTSAGPASHAAKGAQIELVAIEPDGAGMVRGAILIDLEPGWKTYWIEPNGPGLAPLFDFSGSEGVDPPHLRFPAPKRLEESGESFVGYDEPVAILFETHAEPEAMIRLSYAIGICETLCVPVVGDLVRDLRTAASVEEAMAVDRAVLALPPEADAPVHARLDRNAILVAAPADIGAPLDLFLAPPVGWALGMPVLDRNGVWRVPVRETPDQPGDAAPSFEAVALGSSGARRLSVEIGPESLTRHLKAHQTAAEDRP